MIRSNFPSRRAFSLVISLIILTLLSVLVVGFLSSTQLDRTTAHAFLGKSQAELAATTGVNQAIALLREHITEYPDSATFWEQLTTGTGSDNLPVEGTMLYFHDQAPPDGAPVNIASPDTGNYTTTATTATTSKISIRSNPTTRYILPLMSRGLDANGQLLGAVKLDQKTSATSDKPVGEAATPLREITSTSDKGVFVDANCVDLNRARYNGDNVGWIGSPMPEIGAAPKAPRPFRARWIEMKEKAGADGKNDEGKDPRTIGRYAFWIEDESFKVNLNQLGSATTSRGNEWTELGKLKTAAADLAKTSLPAQLAALTPVQGVLRSGRYPVVADRDPIATAATTLRDTMLGQRVPDLRSFNQVPTNATSPVTGDPYRLADDLKFLATTTSASLNVSRQGSQRLNLNGIGFEKRWDNTAVTDADLKKGLDQVVATVRYHAPKFSQRFYRQLNSSSALVLNAENTVPPDTAAKPHRNIYLYKLAANLRDYIDPDSQPTLILDNGKIGPRTRQQLALPNNNGPSASEIWAQGKDSAPFLQEAITRYRSTFSTSSWELQIDYYMEFWNMTDRDLTAADLGPNPFLCVTNQMGWFTVGGGGRTLVATQTRPGALGNPIATDPLRATVVDIRNGVFVNGSAAPKGVVFKAGQCTVITTDPDYLGARKTTATAERDPVYSGPYNTANVYFCEKHLNGAAGSWPKSNRFYKGTTPAGATAIKPDFRDGGEDYVTEVILGNDAGYFEFHASPIAHGGGGKSTTATASPREDWYGGSLYGNSSGSASVSQLGDPRTNNEQLVYTRFTSGASVTEPDQSRYWNTTSAPRFSPGFPNSIGGSALYVNPHLGALWPGLVYPQAAPFPWPDYYRGWNDGGSAANPTRETAPARTFDGIVTDPITGALTPLAGQPPSALYSVGQLGDVYDPARLKGGRGSAGVEGSRGGGRTYRIGQHDDRVELTTPNSPSLAWASWRLVDFLSISNQIQLPGAININGLMRDCIRDKDGNPMLDAAGRQLGAGAALRAACYGMKIFSAARPNGTTSANSGKEGLNTTASTGEKTLDSEEPAKGAALAASLQNVIQQALKRMTDNDPGAAGYSNAKPYFGPFSERGEISELDAFSIGTNLLTGVKMDEAFDRTREELVRRLMELITTRGSVFSVYAIGQSINEGPAPRRLRTVTGTHRVKVTFQLQPKRDDGSDFRVVTESFDPTNASAIQARFAKPHHYDVQILQVSSS